MTCRIALQTVRSCDWFFPVGEQEADAGIVLSDIQSDAGERGHTKPLALAVGQIRAWPTPQHPRASSERANE